MEVSGFDLKCHPAELFSQNRPGIWTAIRTEYNANYECWVYCCLFSSSSSNCCSISVQCNVSSSHIVIVTTIESDFIDAITLRICHCVLSTHCHFFSHCVTVNVITSCHYLYCHHCSHRLLSLLVSPSLSLVIIPVTTTAPCLC